MTIKYWLFVVFAGNLQVVGPFDGVIACERAAAQVQIAVREGTGSRFVKAGTVCMSQKHAEFKYKEPKK